MWDANKKGFRAFLQLEKSLSDHSVEAYLHDLDKFVQWMQSANFYKTPAEIKLNDLQRFIKWLGELGMGNASQARIISGLRAFFKFCLMENIVPNDPSVLLESPKLRRILPDTLSFEEIELIIGQIDLSKAEGGRNKAILETM